MMKKTTIILNVIAFLLVIFFFIDEGNNEYPSSTDGSINTFILLIVPLSTLLYIGKNKHFLKTITLILNSILLALTFLLFIDEVEYLDIAELFLFLIFFLILLFNLYNTIWLYKYDDLSDVFAKKIKRITIALNSTCIFLISMRIYGETENDYTTYDLYIFFIIFLVFLCNLYILLNKQFLKKITLILNSILLALSLLLFIDEFDQLSIGEVFLFLIFLVVPLLNINTIWLHEYNKKRDNAHKDSLF